MQEYALIIIIIYFFFFFLRNTMAFLRAKYIFFESLIFGLSKEVWLFMEL